MPTEDGCYGCFMGWRGIVAFAATVAACSGGGSPPVPVGTPAPEGSGGGFAGMEGSGGSSSGLEGSGSDPPGMLGGTCPFQDGGAAACPMLGGELAWVGCTRITTSTNVASLQSCTCFATETGTGAWRCEIADANPTLPEASGPMTGEPVPPRCEACKTASSDAAPDE